MARPARGRRSPPPSRMPATRSSGSRSTTRSTSAPSSSAGRSRRRSPARCSASTRSTSPTSRRPRSSPGPCWPGTDAAADADADARRRSRPATACPPRRRHRAGCRHGRRRRGARRPPRSPARRRLPLPAGVHRPVGRGGCRDRPDPGAAARPDRPRHDGRLRPALPALDRPAPQGRHAERLVPPAHLGPSGRPADPGLAVHLRPAHRRPGRRGLRRHRVARPADPAGPPRGRRRGRAGRPRTGARRRPRHHAGTPVTEA